MRKTLTETDFPGRWKVQRSIEDRLSGQPGAFEGEALFTPFGAGRLRYEEEGHLRLGSGLPMRARRVYLWHVTADGVEVRFEDGRPFHRFGLAGGAGEDHLCGADLYRVTYGFQDWPQWWAGWTVTGPRKNYRMISRYTRA